ncbi:MAG: AsmA family protein, partial [Gammaproteobacteria bacterium]|nr:AsmA family protein [Gammaproteobacteria bacterium]
MKTPAGLRLLRKLILGVLLLPVLLAALLAFVIWLDTDFHHTRQQIESSFKQVTGHNLAIKGGVSLEFWPATRFVSRQVEVVDHQGKVLFTAEKLLAEVAPLSFFRGKFLGEHLILEKLQINVVRKATSDDAAQQHKHKMVNTDDQQERITGVPFKSIRVIDSAIHIDDQINGKRYELNNLQVALELVSDDGMAINSTLDFVYDNTFKGSFTSSLNLSLGEQLVFEQVVAQLDFIVHEQPLAFKVSGAFSLEPDGQLVQIRETSFVSDALALRASLTARQSHDSLMIETEINHLNPLKAIMLLLEPGAISSQGKALQSLSARVKVRKTASEVRMDVASLQLDNSLLQGSMVFSDNSKHFQFKIDELVIDPYLELLAALPLEFDQSSDNQATETTFAIQFNRLISSHGTLEGLSTKAHLDKGKLLTMQGNLNAKKLNPNGLL